MKTNWLHLLLVLIAMQSTAAVADLHQTHQTGQEHISFNHSDGLNDISNLNQSDNQPDMKVSFDCHHCCHCHGVACHYLLKDDTSFVLYLDSDVVFENFNLYSSRNISPNLRPPIV